MSGFAIDIGALPLGASRLRLEAAPRALDLAEDDWSGPIVGQLGVDRTADRILIRGKVAATARLGCVRCLRRYEWPLEAELDVFADKIGSSGRRGEDEALERDDYMKFHDGRTLDIGEEAREALLLELPITPHCREECRGLCPRCGNDLNEAPCACASAG
jgi:uncharacterized protein